MRFVYSCITSLAMLIATTTLVILPLIFSTTWYAYNCDFHERCSNLGVDGVQERASNMGRYFLHLEPLAADWDPRGAAHLEEVRGMYAVLAIIALVAVLLLIAVAVIDKKQLATAAKDALLILLASSLLLPVFGPFWQKVFHPLMFDNDLWLTRPGEVLWNLTPRVFFRNSAIVLISVSALLNLGIWQFGKRAWKTTTP